ncbi:hypothetical protein QMK19_38890 [Streptomyces sp. H10-C2]|uniref:hypothetical protein n=1 Tax=unclassified Streptomyces TaxID=2593676 RepID=UPI0024B90048|nr:MULTISPECIES: hypothetical protein [unclassified Streptomyces]MDJ0347143.1 hypothetical protein [Streptomyces sp. PH10-H1]MDJ0375402.1 hypothetical protein [Streptomyces sp. H10-C2]
MSTKKSNKPGRLDWTAAHPPAWAATNAAGVAVVTAAAGHLAHMPPVIGLAEGVAGAVASVAVATHRRWSTPNRVYRASAWLLTGGWTSWALAVGPWSSWAPVATLAAGTVLGWGCNAAFREYEQSAPARRAEAEAQARREETRGSWEDRLQRICGIEGCQVVGVEEWEPEKGEESCGYTIEVTLPAGETLAAVQQRADSLRADLRLPMGCGLEINHGKDYGTAIIKVETANAVARTFPYRIDRALTPGSVNDPIEAGRYKDGKRFSTTALRYHCGLVIGQPEGGKTNLLNVVNAELARCVDVLIWHIDVTGAGVTLPWLRAWARDGTAHAPVVDWSASTVEEALIMLRVAEEIIATRKRDYQDRMFAVNDDKIPVDESVPEIIIVTDEAAQLPMSVQKGLDTVINTGRAAAVRAFTCVLRGTRDMASPSMKEMTRLRIAMRVSDEAEYMHIFSDSRGIKKEDAAYQGSGFVEEGNGKPQPFKAYRIEPQDVMSIAKSVAGYRPKLDEVSLGIESAEFYKQRWARTLPLLYSNTDVLSKAAKAAMNGTPVTATRLPDTETQTAPGGVDMDALFPSLGKKPQPPTAPARQTESESQHADSTRAFRQVLDDATWTLGDDDTAAEPLPAPPTLGPVSQADMVIKDRAQLHALDVLRQAGSAGLGVTALYDAIKDHPEYARDRSTLHRWLPRWAAYGHVVRVDRGSGQVAYVAAEYHRAA